MLPRIAGNRLPSYFTRSHTFFSLDETAPPRIKVRHDELVFLSAKLSDSGTVSCEVRNDFGMLRRTMAFEVEGEWVGLIYVSHHTHEYSYLLLHWSFYVTTFYFKSTLVINVRLHKLVAECHFMFH